MANSIVNIFSYNCMSKNISLELEKYMLPCLNKSLFGTECLGCGTQRALLLLLEGNIPGAFHQFPAIFTTILLFGAIGLHFVDKTRSYHRAISILAIANAVIMVVAYAIKINHFLNP